MKNKPRIYVSNPHALAKRGQCDSNCACPNMVELSIPDLIGGSTDGFYQTQENLGIFFTEESNTIVYQPLRPDQLVVMNRTARGIFECFQQPCQVGMFETQEQRAAAVAMAKIGLLRPVGAKTDFLPGKTLDLVAWLHLTNVCNLSCIYCFRPDGRETMSEHTGRAAVEALFLSALKHDFRSVALKYSGGEPTLQFPLLIYLHQYARELSTSTGLQLHETLLTNGVLLNEHMLDQLAESNIQLMISVDGVEAHNRQRPFTNGQGSFAQTDRAIGLALTRGLHPHLSLTITRYNVETLDQAIAYALDRGLTISLNPYRDNPRSQALDLAPSHNALITGVRRAIQVIESRLPQERMIDILFDLVSFRQPHDRSCGVGSNYVVVRPDGKVAACQMQLEQAFGSIFTDDPLDLILNSHNLSWSQSLEARVGCQDCLWRYACAGGCNLQTYQMTGCVDSPSPYCNVYKALYPDLICLEARRMVRWEQPLPL